MFSHRRGRLGCILALLLVLRDAKAASQLRLAAAATEGHGHRSSTVAAQRRQGSGSWHRPLANVQAVLVAAKKSASRPRQRPRPNSIFSQREANRDAAAKAAASGSNARPDYKLTFWGHMVAGAVSRSVAQTALHPANVIKTLLQTKGSFRAILPLTWPILSRGAGAQFLLSLPNGALHFAVLEKTRQAMASMLLPAGQSGAAAMDFLSSSAATILCSVTSTPQMVLTNRIMAGVYPDLATGVSSVMQESGLRGFYAGWWPGLVQKVPSYALTWVMFQQLKDLHFRLARRLPDDAENFWIGCVAAAGSVTFMIPMDAVKTRLVTQTAAGGRIVPYKGIVDCFVRMVREEGVGSLYNSLTPRLMSVVPMIGIQYGVYEFMKRILAEEPVLPPLGLGAKGESGGQKADLTELEELDAASD